MDFFGISRKFTKDRVDLSGFAPIFHREKTSENLHRQADPAPAKRRNQGRERRNFRQRRTAGSEKFSADEPRRQKRETRYRFGARGLIKSSR
ncbi:MAG: hypothetical protein WBX18_03040 [Terracidiphilus sp.]